MTVIKHFGALSTIQNTWKIAYHKIRWLFWQLQIKMINMNEYLTTARNKILTNTNRIKADSPYHPIQFTNTVQVSRYARASDKTWLNTFQLYSIYVANINGKGSLVIASNKIKLTLNNAIFKDCDWLFIHIDLILSWYMATVTLFLCNWTKFQPINSI